MSTRRDARERALGLCYEAEIRTMSIDATVDALPMLPDAYALQLARGVATHLTDIDELLAKYSEHWTLDRMPAIDRAILRIGVYELGWEPDLPRAVAVSEAVELAKLYSTKDSGRFVNGLLGRIADDLRPAE
ncbi:MAG: transcription antitermination factor NusB [Acidimicrobiia bacterium]